MAKTKKNTSCMFNVQFQKKSIPTPGQGRSLGIPRVRGFLKAQNFILEAKYEAKLELRG